MAVDHLAQLFPFCEETVVLGLDVNDLVIQTQQVGDWRRDKVADGIAIGSIWNVVRFEQVGIRRIHIQSLREVYLSMSDEQSDCSIENIPIFLSSSLNVNNVRTCCRSPQDNNAQHDHVGTTDAERLLQLVIALTGYGC